MTDTSALITLDQARELLRLMEQDDVAAANELIRSFSPLVANDLFAEIGKLTRDLHQSITQFEVDPRLSAMVQQDIPDAAERLSYVITMTEQAANRTMDAVEESLPHLEKTHGRLQELLPAWDQLMQGDIYLGEFKDLCHSVDNLLRDSLTGSEQVKQQLTDVLMAQDYQDLTGQVLRRVIDLVHEVEDKLVLLLSEFGKASEQAMAAEQQTQAVAAETCTVAEGPVLKPESRDDVVSGQDEVDDLLSSLGF